MVAQAACVDRRRDEVVAKCVHRHERSQLAGVSEVVRERTARQRRARGGLAREHLDLLAGDLLAQERKAQACEVRAASDAADDEVGELSGLLHLSERLLTDDRLVGENVIEDAAERVGGVLPPCGILDSLRDRDAQAPG